jgi:hypothetical protein
LTNEFAGFVHVISSISRATTGESAENQQGTPNKANISADFTDEFRRGLAGATGRARRIVSASSDFCATDLHVLTFLPSAQLPRPTVRPAGTLVATHGETMDIRFVSTLTAEDEERVGAALLAALVALLNELPITYALRIETTGHKVFQQTNWHDSNAAAAPPSARPSPEQLGPQNLQ